MWLVVGLGNPGAKYDGTRHNIGFEAVDALAERYATESPKAFKGAEVRRGLIEGAACLFVKPQTYMNRSGDAVGNIMRFYKGESSRVIVIHDELDFEPGEVKLKKGGGAGGHNGLRSIISHIGAEFLRVRMGIGKPRSSQQGADFVLNRFDQSSRERVNEALDIAVDAVAAILNHGVSRAMNQFNRRIAEKDPQAVEK